MLLPSEEQQSVQLLKNLEWSKDVDSGKRSSATRYLFAVLIFIVICVLVWLLFLIYTSDSQSVPSVIPTMLDINNAVKPSSGGSKKSAPIKDASPVNMETYKVESVPTVSPVSS